jgi:phenylacetate-CoA ligase
VVRNGRWTEAARHAIVDGLRQRMGVGVKIELRLMDAIPPEASGKHRYVVSHVPLAAGLRDAA